MTPSGIEPATFRHVAQRHNKPCHRVTAHSDIKVAKVVRCARFEGLTVELLKTQNLLGCCIVKTAKQLPAFRRNVVPSERRCLPVETVWRHWALQIFCVGSVSAVTHSGTSIGIRWIWLWEKHHQRLLTIFVHFCFVFFSVSNTNYTECSRVCMIHNPHINPIFIYWKKLRADWGQGMLAIIRCRTFCLPVCYPKI